MSLEVNATRPTAVGFLTVWPAGADRPWASNLNFMPGQTMPNVVVVAVGQGPKLPLSGSAKRWISAVE